MSRDAASEAQVRAADPGASTWLSANAGSGKTRVLTDRVARLLMMGVEPQHILCLTYTKAAASEMQNRLFRRLGEWAMLPEAELRAALAALGIEGGVEAEVLANARRLFARAIETPGGLKIQTIHSFCAALLRRFPLEAGVTPQFAEMDDRAATLLREEIVEEMAADIPAAVDAAARHLSEEDFTGLAAELSRHRAGFAAPLSRAGALALFDLPADYAEPDLLAEVFLGGEADWMPAVVAAMTQGGANDLKAAERLALLPLDAPDLATLAVLEDVLLFGASAAEPFTAKLNKFPTKAVRAALGPLLDRLEDMMRRVEAARGRRIALLAAEKTHALHLFAGAFLPRYEARKAARGWLDFDDLILKARGLLTDPSVAQWVLFRLDGGIDHILVDEAQDTSPEQWRVIELLAQEFTTGHGAREVPRTIFVVGDKKQSIYSFQGADLSAFDRMRDHFRTRLAEVRIPLADLSLEYSFRSSPAVLRLVDRTFDEGRGAGLGGAVNHLAFKQGMPGRVDLWPAIEPVSDPEPEAWFDPVDLISDRHHSAQLAQRIAAELARLIREGVTIPAEKGPRPMTEGDVLILVQRRSDLFHEIIRACKAEGLAIAGADRLKLGAELAVKDLAALLSFVATDEDDLSLAAALRSPLFGWSEAELFALATGRGELPLWAALRARAADHPRTVEILTDLRDSADFLRPYDLIERMLSRHHGRQRLLARLGPEAEDGIDELLGQALAYERSEVPSLTGFLTWLETDDVEVKRQPDSAGNRIRVMTVHGAKGLEAPVVILPDTADRNASREPELTALAAEDPGQGAVAWKTAAAASPPILATARAERRQRQEEENMRLLYVALTRAQCWLIVCAAGKVGKVSAWYRQVETGLRAAGEGMTLAEVELPFGPVQRLSFGDWPEPATGVAGAAAMPAQAGPGEGAPADAALPDWATTPAPPPGPKLRPLSPSGLGGAKVLAGEGALPALDGEEATRRGRMLHLLLEHLPLWPAADWPDLARDLLSGGEDAARDTAEVAELMAEASAVLSAPALAPLFGPDALAEVDIAASIAGRPMLGTIDRLILTPGRALAIDYKSNALVPARAEEVPEGLLRQMGAYAVALAQVFPDRQVEVAILWTRAAVLMPLPLHLVHDALAATSFP